MAKVDNKAEETAKSTYERLENDRRPYLDRARKCAKLTLPHLFPDEGSSGSAEFTTPYQSIGARGVNNLGAKIILAIMPPNAPFFRLQPNEEVLNDLKNGDSLKDDIDDALRSLEKKVMRYIDAYQIRVTIGEAIRHLIVGGNALLFLPPDKDGIKLYRLDSYVIQRDALGNVIQIVACDKLSYATLDDNLKSLVDEKDAKPEEPVEVYTHVFREGDNFQSYQEIDGKRVAGSDQTYPATKTSWLPLRMNKVDGESYARSYIEEYIGDLTSCENLSKAVVDMASIAAAIRFLVNPTGVTRPKKVAETPNGGFVMGRKQDIEALQLDKYNDMQVAKTTVDAIESRLSFIFLFNSAVQRNGERVTAEEIRYVAGELEDTLGGIYSILSQELQLPLVNRLLTQLQKNGTIPDLPEGVTEPQVTTGMEALGRGQDLRVLEYFIQLSASVMELRGSGLKISAVLSAAADALGLSKNEFVMSDSEMEQMAQEQQAAAMGQQMVPEMAKEAMKQEQ